ncbi:MAG: PEGA domain-containing protein [Rhodothermales bacterium]|nr:PEGA domain-containing protein [Rhodothermales bacterium]
MGGWLVVRSDPEGAVVLVDGVHHGRTPTRIPDLLAGTHEVRVQHPGFEPAVQSVELPAGRPHVVDVALARVQGTLQIIARPWGSIYVDGTLREADTDLALDVDLPPGPHEVRIEHPHLGAWERTIEVEAGQRTRVLADLRRSDG